jgi:outer membrane protein OmpA-like peptidoglycan-associated protein
VLCHTGDIVVYLSNKVTTINPLDRKVHMKKLAKKLILCGLSCLGIKMALAVPGYVATAYDSIVKTAYGQCVHTAYFEKDVNGIAECGEAIPAPAPVAVVAPKPQVVYETVTLSDADRVLFKFDSAKLTSAGEALLTDFLNKISYQSDITKVMIAGYTDALGSYSYNMRLSQQRSDAVAKLFIAKGYNQDKITIKGYGPQYAKVSTECFNKYGHDNYTQIVDLKRQLAKTNDASTKQTLAGKLKKAEKLHATLVACAMPDRKVVFTIEHTKQEEKQQSVADPLATPDANS